MVQKLEAIKGGGGSIRVGTTGTISALMTREMDSIKSAKPSLASSRDKPRTVPVSVSCSASTPKRSQARKSLDEACSSGGCSSSGGTNCRSPDTPRKTKSNTRSSHRIPMLGSDNISLDRTPSREKTEKKGTNVVEIVDIKCGQSDRAWATPITSKLKKLGFSKLSESII